MVASTQHPPDPREVPEESYRGAQEKEETKAGQRGNKLTLVTDLERCAQRANQHARRYEGVGNAREQWWWGCASRIQGRRGSRAQWMQVVLLRIFVKFARLRLQTPALSWDPLTFLPC